MRVESRTSFLLSNTATNSANLSSQVRLGEIIVFCLAWNDPNYIQHLDMNYYAQSSLLFC